MDRLYSLGLVDQVVKDRGLVFYATSYDSLQKLFLEQKSKINELEVLLPGMISTLEREKGLLEKEYQQITYYKDLKGLKQITWNSLRAHKEILIFEMVSNMSEFMDQEFSEEVRREIVKRKIRVRQITNYKKIKAFTKVTDKVIKYWEPRYVDPKTLKLSYEVLIYNDVVSLYSYKNKNFSGLEIKSKSLADMQKQMFEFVWKN